MSSCGRRQWHLVALLGDATRCLGGDVLRDGHGGHGLQRRRVRSGEAAAHALVDGTIPGEAAVLRQRALLTAHWGESIQSLTSGATEQRRKGQRCNFCRNLLGKSYCLIWESWGKSQLHTEGKTREEEALRLIWPSPLLPPIQRQKTGGQSLLHHIRRKSKDGHHLVERRFSLHFPSAGHLFLVFCLLRSSASLLVIYTSVLPACDDVPSQAY